MERIFVATGVVIEILARMNGGVPHFSQQWEVLPSAVIDKFFMGRICPAILEAF